MHTSLYEHVFFLSKYQECNCWVTCLKEIVRLFLGGSIILFSCQQCLWVCGCSRPWQHLELAVICDRDSL